MVMRIRTHEDIENLINFNIGSVGGFYLRSILDGSQRSRHDRFTLRVQVSKSPSGGLFRLQPSQSRSSVCSLIGDHQLHIIASSYSLSQLNDQSFSKVGIHSHKGVI